MQAINFALEDALRSRVREYPEKALRWVESLHAGNGGADALDLLRMKGRDVFCIWYLEKAWKRLPRGLDTDAVEDVSVLAGCGAANCADAWTRVHSATSVRFSTTVSVSGLSHRILHASSLPFWAKSCRPVGTASTDQRSF
jgi:hypothetical protein